MRIVQMVDALDFGDGVSNDIINLHRLMDAMKIQNTIYSKWKHEKVAQYTHDIEKYSPRPNDYILYHYSGKSVIIDQVLGYNRPVILRYHNITPPEFFIRDNPEIAARCQEGLDQIKAYVKRFDFYCGDSGFNNRNLIEYGASPERTSVLPIELNLSQLRDKETDAAILEEMKRHTNVLFVGRFAPNKRIEEILDVFENYYRYYNDAAYLYLVGNNQQNELYTRFIESKLKEMMAREHVIVTGKVDERQLYSYYTGANVFLCMSEHEGFCIPLLEAMEFETPVIAYDAGAVADTMGKSGVLVTNKEVPVIAGLINELDQNKYLRDRVIGEQKKHLRQFDAQTMRQKLSELISVWTGEER